MLTRVPENYSMNVGEDCGSVHAVGQASRVAYEVLGGEAGGARTRRVVMMKIEVKLSCGGGGRGGGGGGGV
jgi:hypothetical protein